VAWRRALLDALLPRRCLGCRRRGAWMCAACSGQVHKLRPPVCDLCGREIAARQRCQACARQPPKWAGMRAAARYELLLREAIHSLKYAGHRGLAVELAAWLEVAAAAYVDQVEVLVPVPLHPARERARGYNQSALLARELGQRCHLPVEGELLARVVDTRDQVKLTRAERQRNVRGAFACTHANAVAGRSLLLVDDVCTTGSTLLACAAALTAAGAGSVRAVVLARQDAARE